MSSFDLAVSPWGEGIQWRRKDNAAPVRRILPDEGRDLRPIAQRSVMAALTDVAIGQGLKGHQVWGMAPTMPQA